MTRSGTDNQPIPLHQRPHLVPVEALPPPGPEESTPTSGNQPGRGLPVPFTAFIGREEAVASLIALLTSEGVRLLTLTGPGGVGKTRLALQVATQVLPDYPDGVLFVDLAPLPHPDLVLPTLAQALGVEDGGRRPLLDTLGEHLHGQHTLLLLDNFEQVAAAGPQVSALLAAAPGVQALVTSRVPLGCYGEREFPVAPLALPAPDEAAGASAAALAGYEAVQLFVARVRDLRPDFALADENAAVVAAICRQLDGLPLALELAAARTRLFAPAALLARLDRRLPLLTGGATDRPARQQTLRAALAWSYDLLDAPEQALFARLGVFSGAAGLDAVAAVAAPPGLEPGALLDQLESLIAQNLLRPEAGVGGEPRFGMLETIREYAREQLAASDAEEAARRQQARFFVALAEQGEPELKGPQQEFWLARLEEEHDHFRAVLDWALGRGADGETAVRLAGALWRFWWIHGHGGEGRRWLTVALEREAPEASPWRARALQGAGVLAATHGDFAAARARCEESAALWRVLGDKPGLATTLNSLGIIIHDQGDYVAARATLAESLALRRELGDQWGIASTLSNLGLAAQEQGDVAAAAGFLEESLAINRALENKEGIATALNNLGLVVQERGDYAAARALHEESLALARELSDTESIAISLSNLGFVAREQGDYAAAGAHYGASLALAQELGDQRLVAESLEEVANVAGARGQARHVARLLAAATALREAIGTPLPPAGQDRYTNILTAARAQLDDAAWTAAWEAGRGMSVAQAVAAAQAALADPAGPAPAVPTPAAAPADLLALTEREREVLRLLAAGLTNKEIAGRLHLSPRTVQAHLYRIFDKLDVTTRGAAVRYALDHDLA